MSQDWRHKAVKGLFNHPALATPLARAANAVGATDERRHAWRTWASQKFGGRLGGRVNINQEILTLFPGWAARRYQISPELPEGESASCEVEVFVSGYAISCRPKDQASRSQRAFIRLAKGFAGLPKVTGSNGELNSLPPQIPDEYQAQALDFELQRAKSADSGSDSDSLSEKDPSPLPSPPHTPPPFSYSPSPTPPPKEINTPADLIEKLHHNLESRLQLFWSSTLPSRTIRLHLFTPSHRSSHNTNHNSTHADDHILLATQNVTTGVDGSFNARFRVNWNDLSKHPRARHIVFGRPVREHELLIVAELLPPLVPSAPTTTSNSTPFLPSLATPHHPTPPTLGSHPHLPSYPHLHSLLSTLSSLSSLTSLLSPSATASTHIRIPITHCPIRVVSDIDDTVKMSGVPEGARAVFQNVFMKELKDGVIPGMGEWYSAMWEKGVRFHYVSNGPFEYLSVLHEFFEISKLPPGSIKLKSYAGRSLLSGLLSTPAARKRAGVVDILDSFPDSKFILIGDSGEQDLELYADLARERPDQILAVFIRDAEESCYDPIDDPIGWKVVGAGAAGTRPGSEPLLDYTSASSTSSRQSTVTQEDQHATPKANSSGFPLDMDGAGQRYSTSRPLSEEPVDPLVHAASDWFEEDTPKARNTSAFPGVEDPSMTGIPLATDLLLSTTRTLQPDNQYITSPPPPVPPPSITPATPHSNNRFRCYMTSRSKSASGSTGSSRSSSPSSSSFSLNFRPNSNGRSGISMRGGSSGSSGSSSSSGSSGGKLTEGGRKRTELQTRVHRARTQMPSEVPLRVFRNPVECEEVERFVRGVARVPRA